MAQWRHGLAASPCLDILTLWGQRLFPHGEQTSPPSSIQIFQRMEELQYQKKKYHLRLHWWVAVTNMSGHVVASCDLFRDGGREGEGVILVKAIPKKSRALAGLRFYSCALSPPVFDHQGTWDRFDIDWPFYSEERTFYFLRPLHLCVTTTYSRLLW